MCLSVIATTGLESKYIPNNIVGEWRLVHSCVIYPVLWYLCHDSSVHLSSFFRPRSEPSFWKLDRSGPCIMIKTLQLGFRVKISFVMSSLYLFSVSPVTPMYSTVILSSSSLMTWISDSNYHFIGHTWEDILLIIWNLICWSVVMLVSSQVWDKAGKDVEWSWLCVHLVTKQCNYKPRTLCLRLVKMNY